MSDTKHYFINNDSHIIMYFAAKPAIDPEGFEYCGLSQMPIKGAAGYYSKNQEGFKIIDGDKKEEPNDKGTTEN